MTLPSGERLPLSLYSANTVAISLPMFFFENADILLPPSLSSEMFTCGRPYSSALELASVMLEPPRITRFFSTTGRPLRSNLISLPAGARPAAAAARSALSSTSRNSRVAVAPKISLARAVSCTPGSSTTIRVAPWR
ncbi:Uncharacterised protein [Vibrio cholerae]|nr:Uncharacterised protein [Vibrio cholerae]CSB48156.1 Uncharacterised protein [Vibrio cholerae]